MVARWIEHTGTAGTVLAFVVISVLAVQTSQVQTIDDFNDKAKHVFAFAVLAYGLMRYWRQTWSMTFSALLFYGIGIEVVQTYVPGRTSSAWDVVADLVGISVGILLGQVLAKERSHSGQ